MLASPTHPLYTATTCSSSNANAGPGVRVTAANAGIECHLGRPLNLVGHRDAERSPGRPGAAPSLRHTPCPGQQPGSEQHLERVADQEGANAGPPGRSGAQV